MIKKHAWCILLVVVGLSSCLKAPQADSTPVSAPQGTFKGQFIKEYKNNLTNVRDTVITNIQLVLNGNKYQVTDPEGIHANSRGIFGFTTAFSMWSDSTAIGSNIDLNQAPYHLNGSFAYTFTSTDLILEAYNETLKYSYKLKKQ